MNQHPVHFDAAYAAKSEFGRPLVNSCLTLSIVAGMSVAAVLLSDRQIAAQHAAALSGQVSSAEDGAMEGVLVSARRDGSTITTTVVSDDKGHYAFPADRMEPGRYTLAIRGHETFVAPRAGTYRLAFS